MCLQFAFLLITRRTTWLRLSQREEAWQTAEILILRHQLAVLQRRQPHRPHLTNAQPPPRCAHTALSGNGVLPAQPGLAISLSLWPGSASNLILILPRPGRSTGRTRHQVLSPAKVRPGFSAADRLSVREAAQQYQGPRRSPAFRRRPRSRQRPGWAALEAMTWPAPEPSPGS